MTGSLGGAVIWPWVENPRTLDGTILFPIVCPADSDDRENDMLTALGVTESWKVGWSASHVLTKAKRPAVLRHSAFECHLPPLFRVIDSHLQHEVATCHTGPVPSSLGIQLFREKGTRAKRLVVRETWCGISLGLFLLSPNTISIHPVVQCRYLESYPSAAHTYRKPRKLELSREKEVR